MADELPMRPDAVPAAVHEELAECSPDELRAVAEYASALAAHRDGGAIGEGDGEETTAGGRGEEDARDAADDEPATAEAGEAQDDPDDRPADVPPNATVTIKEINDNRYYYWQWRDGDTVKSKYKSPAAPDG